MGAGKTDSKDPFADLVKGLKKVKGELESQSDASGPEWSRYVAVTPGSSIEQVIFTGLSMQAAISGKKLVKESFDISYIISCKDKKCEEFFEDVNSKVPEIFEDRTDNSIYFTANGVKNVRKVFSNEDTLVVSHSCFIDVYSFNEDTINFIKRSVEFHKDSSKDV